MACDVADVLQSVLRSDGSPPFLKRRAITALSHLDIPVALGSVSDLLFADEASVAYSAFDSADGLPSTNRIIISAAVAQLQKLQDAYANKQALSHNQAALLGKVALILKLAYRADDLLGDELHDVRKAVVLLTGANDRVVLERVVSLFAELSNDDDHELIVHLLSSNSARVWSRAALACSRCSPDMILRHKRVLIALLDDDSADVRNFALYALRKGLGEKAGSYLSKPEYEVQKARVLEKYREQSICSTEIHPGNPNSERSRPRQFGQDSGLF
jgi:hypothetical protein